MLGEEARDQSGVNGSIDATQDITIARNSDGQVASYTRGGGLGGTGAGALTSTTQYTSGLVTSIQYPSGVVTTATYGDATSPLPTSVTQADGTVIDLSDRDPATAQQRSVTRNSLYTEYFAYDEFERPASVWDNVHAGTRWNPLQSLSYQFSTNSQPAVVTSSTLVDAAASSVIRSATLFSSVGVPLAAAAQIGGDQWFLAAARTIDSLNRESDSYFSTTIRPTPLAAFLDAARVTIGSASVTPLGFPKSQSATIASGVTGTTSLASTSNGSTFATTASTLDSADGLVKSTTISRTVTGEIESFKDEAGQTGIYAYDGLGRLKKVTTPGSTAVMTITYDDHGRVASVVRTGAVPTEIDYEYNGFGLATKTTKVGTVVQRYDLFDYDAHGRLRATITTPGETLSAAGASKQTFLYYYDGATLSAPASTAASQRGFLTGVAGAGYEKQFSFFPDGSLQHELVDLGEYAVSSDFAYFDSGALRSEATQLIASQASQACAVEAPPIDVTGKHTSTRDIRLDQGRPVDLFVNGQNLAHIKYDNLGRVSGAFLADGSAMIPSYDGTTLAQTGAMRFAADGTTTTSAVAYTSRGLIATETMGTTTTTPVTRAYTYKPEGYLDHFQDSGAAQVTYAYDGASGMPTTTHGTTYGALDAQGRVTSRTAGGTTANYTYNARGQIAGACLGAGCSTPTITYTYDEAGQRIARHVNGAFDRAYTDAGVIDGGVSTNGTSDGGGLTTTLDIAGWHLGTLRKGVFTSLATDMRGTVLGQLKSGGAAVVPSAFGMGAAVSASTSAVTSFTEQPLDADLGLVRMGVRDYDPTTGRFLQPDSLYLANPAMCIGDHAGCNLYSYAGNDPVNFVDPSGYATETGQDAAQYCKEHPSDCSLSVGGTPSAGDNIGGSNLGSQAQLNQAYQVYANAVARNGGAGGGGYGTVMFQGRGPSAIARIPIVGGIYSGINSGVNNLAIGNYADASHDLIGAGIDGINLYGLKGLAASAIGGIASTGPVIGQSFGRVGTVIANPGIAIKGLAGSFEEGHAITQIISRGVTPAAILNTVRDAGVYLQQQGGRVLALTADAGVVITSEGQIVTTYVAAEFNAQIAAVVQALGL